MNAKKLIQLNNLLSKISDLREDIKKLTAEHSWEGDIIRDQLRHLELLELDVSDHKLSLEA